uniref:Uncharacterized protein n=1 Tax=Arundo donax TaxID=35708 RepID=A0A0A9FKS7_ARUDO
MYHTQFYIASIGFKCIKKKIDSKVHIAPSASTIMVAGKIATLMLKS